MVFMGEENVRAVCPEARDVILRREDRLLPSNNVNSLGLQNDSPSSIKYLMNPFLLDWFLFPKQQFCPNRIVSFIIKMHATDFNIKNNM